ncbi:AhpC/TSA family protein [Chitinophaga agrisoli]|uniref:AhpC/TSA family protein n=1 Tax=Chitinophaga agrisoli TaxID=2607653 RepID=A0A5B2VIR5_9BACT|nr:TlpA disulfide reductase family protein [Chitinophaga agrisoli]KAA2238538.1 AhpC/TSA family protein [Chitinophaga agrisoli]
MKRTCFLAITLAAMAFSCQGQQKDKLTLTGHIRGLQDSVIHIYYDGEHADTVPVQDGHFTWSRRLPEPAKLFVTTSRRYLEFFGENGTMQLSAHIDSTEQMQVTGSPVQDEYQAYKNSLKDIEEKEYPLYDEYAKVKGNEAATAKIDDQLEEYRKQTRERTLNYISQHPASVVSANLVAGMASMGEYSKVLTAYNQLAPSVRNTATGKKIVKRLEVLKRSAIGAKMKDFTQADPAGKPFQSSALRGKYVLVDFWASWCGPCRAENPNVLKAYNTYKDKNFTVLGVSLDDKADRWQKAIKEDGMPWQQVSDLKGWKNEVSNYYGINGIPSNFLIDPQGNIVAKDLRGVALQRKLAEVIQ